MGGGGGGGNCVCDNSIKPYNSAARKLPIQKCFGKIAVQLKLH